MTDITDQDKREARKWAEQTIANRVNSPTDPWVIAARLFLANEEPPAPTLAEGLAHITEHWEEWATEKINTALTDATIHAKQVEHDLAEARAKAKTWREQDENDCKVYMEELASVRAALAEARTKVGSLTVQAATAEQDRKLAWRAMDKAREEKAAATHERDEARAEVDRLTAERDEATVSPDQQSNSLKTPNSSFKSSLKESAQNPADVPSGEPWIVEVDGERRTAVRAAQYHRPWSTFREAGSVVFEKDHEITLVSRFVPAPRVITDSEELDQLAATSIIRDGRGWPGGITDQGVTMINGFCLSDEEVLAHGPVTVLWEAGK